MQGREERVSGVRWKRDAAGEGGSWLLCVSCGWLPLTMPDLTPLTIQFKWDLAYAKDLRTRGLNPKP